MATITLSLGSYSLDAITEIKIYRNTGSVSAQPEYLITTLSGTTKEYIDNDVVEDQNYRYLIVATTTEGEVIESYTQYAYPMLPYSEKPIIPTPTLTVNDRTISGDTIAEIGDHISTDWVLERTDGVGGEISISDTSNKVNYTTWRIGVFNTRARYVGSEYSTEWSSGVRVSNPAKSVSFLGEVAASNFITGDDLANRIGLTAGTSQFSDEPWLKFILDGETIYVAKKPLRHTISWEDIYQAGAVYGTGDNGSNPSGGSRLQDASVTIGGYDFKVTLLKGANDDPTPNETGYDEPFTHNSEWNVLMYPIHSGVHTYSGNPGSGSVPFNQWASYSDEDLLVHRNFDNGSYSWTQETHGASNNYRLFRGYYGVTSVNGNGSTTSNSRNGWRPVLRLIQ